MVIVTVELGGKQAYLSPWCCSPFTGLGEVLSGDGADLRRSSLLYAGPRQGRCCLPRTGEHKPCLLTSCRLQRLPTHFILWLSYIIDAASPNPPSGVPKDKGGSGPAERGRWYCRLVRLKDPFSCSVSGGCGGHSLENSIVFSLSPFLWSYMIPHGKQQRRV